MHKEERLRNRELVWDISHSDEQPEEILGNSMVNHELAFDVEIPLEGELNGTNAWQEVKSRYNLKKIYSKLDLEEEYSLKRSFDILLAFLGILFSFPLWVIIAAAVWCEDGGPTFYCSERVGKRGRIFKHIKFRTMIPNSDNLFGPLQAKENDRRITRVGKLLRVTAIDELPQLWNVLKGDMSVVGPRALLPVEIEVEQVSSNSETVAVPLEKIRGYWKRHSVKPGLTGIAQIYAPRDIIRRRKFQYDLLYVRRQCLWLDVKLIMLSFWITLRGKWESRGRKF